MILFEKERLDAIDGKPRASGDDPTLGFAGKSAAE